MSSTQKKLNRFNFLHTHPRTVDKKPAYSCVLIRVLLRIVEQTVRDFGGKPRLGIVLQLTYNADVQKNKK